MCSNPRTSIRTSPVCLSLIQSSSKWIVIDSLSRTGGEGLAGWLGRLAAIMVRGTYSGATVILACRRYNQPYTVLAIDTRNLIMALIGVFAACNSIIIFVSGSKCNLKREFLCLVSSADIRGGLEAFIDMDWFLGWETSS